MNGYGGMRSGELSPSEKTALGEVEHKWNVKQCREGYESCGRSQLTKQEAALVITAELSACAKLSGEKLR